MTDDPMRVRGFNLIELAIAMAIAAILATAATSATMSIYQNISRIERQTFADEENKVVLDFLGTLALQNGGGDVRPWAAIHNGCRRTAATTFSCSASAAAPGTGSQVNGGNRLDLIQVNDTASSCTLPAGYTPASTSVTFALSGGVCCLADTNAYKPTGVNVVIVPSDTAGGGWRARRCVPNVGSCTCALSTITGVFELPDTTSPAATWTGGVLVAGDVISVVHDSTAKTLSEVRDIDADGDLETRLISDRVWDFRVQYGYDAQPEDGKLDSAWVSKFDDRTDTTLNSNPPGALRMLRVGVISGGRVPTRTSSTAASLFGGPLVTETSGYQLRAASTSVTMRNLLVFY